MSVREIERRMVDIYQTQCREDKVYKAAQRINDLKLQRWHLMRDGFEWTDENISRLEASTSIVSVRVTTSCMMLVPRIALRTMTRSMNCSICMTLLTTGMN